MTLIAEFQIAGEGVLLLPALGSVPGMELQLERTIVDEDVTHFLWAAGDDFEAFERAAEEDPTVADIELVEDADESRLYCVSPSLSETISTSPIERDVGASRISLSLTSEGVEKRMRFPDRDAMQEYFERMRDEGFEISLQRVYQGGENDSTGRWGISEKQRSALQQALEEGYYDVPRDADLADVADSLGVSRQAASERLRRGIRRLLEYTVGEPEQRTPGPENTPSERNE